MMTQGHKAGEFQMRPISVKDVITSYRHLGIKCFIADNIRAWVSSEKWSMSRFPLIVGPPPSVSETSVLFRLPGVWVIDFLENGNTTEGSNSTLYIFNEPKYSLDLLDKSGRRDARKAFRELDIQWISHEQLMKYGLEAYCDCRARVGLSDGTPRHFQNRFYSLKNMAGYYFLGAWKGENLTAFMTLSVVENSVSIAVYSDSKYKSSCPNDGLISFALNYCVNENQFDHISYGLSSIQEESKSGSLHHFKLKVGFKAIPVRRVFIVHPMIGFIVCRASLAIFHFILIITPGNRIIKKASGVMKEILSNRQIDKTVNDDHAS